MNDVENYSDFLYDEPNEYQNLLNRDYVINLSPILYLESLSRLMCAIVNGIIGNKDKSLLQYILEKVASKYEEFNNTTNHAIFAKDNLDFSRSHMDIINNLTVLALRKLEF